MGRRARRRRPDPTVAPIFQVFESHGLGNRPAKVTGRSDDMLIIRGVNVFPSQVEELILRQPQLAPHYVLEVSRDGSLDELTVRVEPHPGSMPLTEFTQAAANLKHHIKVYIGVTADVVVVDPGSVERSVGKAKRVIDRRV